MQQIKESAVNKAVENCITIVFKKDATRKNTVPFYILFSKGIEEEEIKQIFSIVKAHNSNLVYSLGKYNAQMARPSIRFLFNDICKLLERINYPGKNIVLKIKIGDVYETFSKATEIFKTQNA